MLKLNAQIDNIELRLGCLPGGLTNVQRAGDGLALNRLAMARNSGGLQV